MLSFLFKEKVDESGPDKTIGKGEKSKVFERQVVHVRDRSENDRSYSERIVMKRIEE